jgi:carbamoyltransferase
MKGAFLGPEYSDEQVKKMARAYDAVYSEARDPDELAVTVAGYLSEGKIVGWFQGKMEFGPRALGSRSILADARDPGMQKKMNLKIKRREGSGRLQPSVLEEDVADYFDVKTISPYMMFVVPVKECRLKNIPDIQLNDVERIYQNRSDIPSVTHIDNSARIQTVSKTTNPGFWKLLTAFKQITGCSVLINSSFNVRGEPIVCTPEQGFRCFMKTEMDWLVMGNIIFDKKQQGHINMKGWKDENVAD